MRSHELLFLARHGETDWNAAGRWQGSSDIPLNAEGRMQAQVLGARLRDEEVRVVVASDLIRARETAEIAARVLGLTLAYVDADLRERSMGVFEGLTRAECADRFPDAWSAWSEDARSTPQGGEAYDDVATRALRGLARAREAATGKGRVLVVSHGGAIRAALGRLTGAPVHPVRNASVFAVTWSGAGIVGTASLLD